MLAIINDSAIPVFESLLLSNFSAHNQEMSKQLGMLISCLSKASEAITVLRDNQEVCRGHRVNVSEGQ